MKRLVNRGFFFILILLALAIFAIFFALNNDDSELLVVWGKQDMGGSCFIWLIEPEEDNISSPMVGEDDCNYQIMNVAG
jgi:hypothetical protein